MVRLKKILGCGLVVVAFVSGTLFVHAAKPVPTDDLGRPIYRANALFVKLEAAASSAVSKSLPRKFGVHSLDEICSEIGVHRVERMFRTRSLKAHLDLPDLSRIYRVSLPEGTDVRRAATLFSGSPDVEYAEPIPMYYIDETPDDEKYSAQPFLPQIMAEAAWDVHKGEDGAEIVVGIADSGVAWRHEDLVDNIFQNLGEDADGDGKVIEQSGDSWIFDPGDVNGIDDDGNGYIDDFVGWNFWNDNNQQDNDPDDPQLHGTHVAGLAAARTNNGVGVASISWNVKILATSASNTEAGDSIVQGLACVVYLAENGADIINMSWGGSGTSQTQQDVMDYANGLGSILVAAAGNDSTSGLHYPSALRGVLSVAAVASSDRLTSYSNYGISIDISTPGGLGLNGLFSTIPSGYRKEQGTSMASPVTAGVFALVKSLNPGWSNEQLIEQVLGTADSIDDVNQTYVGQMGHGRVNAYEALAGIPSTAEPELRLAVLGVTVEDDTGDGALEGGEGAELAIELRNYNHLAGSQSVTLTLQSDDPYIQVVDSTVTTSIGADSNLEPEDTFSIEVASDAPSGLYHLSLTADATGASVSPASELDLPAIIVANGGVLVWDGADGITFSGSYLAGELESRDYEVTYVVGAFPTSLAGFDGVFLSFGNAGIDDPDLGLDYLSARLDADWKVDAIEQYLKSGGRLYLEGSDTLGYDIYDLVDGTHLLPLFGIESGVDGTTNEITSLDGYEGTLTEGTQFTETTQDPVDWIDIFTTGSGETALTESDYGVVAVQHSGQYGQRTFAFAYTIADLVDGSTTKAELLDEILEFLSIGSDVGRPLLIRRPGRRLSPGSTSSKLFVFVPGT